MSSENSAEGLREALAKLCDEWEKPAVNYRGDGEDGSTDVSWDPSRVKCARDLRAILALLAAPPSRQAIGADEVVEACAQHAEKCFSDVAEKGTCDYIAEGLRKTFKGTFTLTDDERRRIAETALRMFRRYYCDPFSKLGDRPTVESILAESRKEPRA